MMIADLRFGSAPEVWFPRCVQVVERLCLERGLDGSGPTRVDFGSRAKQMKAVRQALDGRLETVVVALADGMSIGVRAPRPLGLKPHRLGMSLHYLFTNVDLEWFRAMIGAVASETSASQATLADNTMGSPFDYLESPRVRLPALRAEVFDRFHAGSGGFDYWVGDALAQAHGVVPGLLSSWIGPDRVAVVAAQERLRASSITDLDPWRDAA